MNHSGKRRRQALHQIHHHYYLNISVEAANLSDWRIESKKNRFGSETRIESKFFCSNWNALPNRPARPPAGRSVDTSVVSHPTSAENSGESGNVQQGGLSL